MALAILAYLALIGILARAAWRNGATEKAMFVLNLALLWLSAIWLFGYPALILPAVLAAIGILALLVTITAGDLRAPPDAPSSQQGGKARTES